MTPGPLLDRWLALCDRLGMSRSDATRVGEDLLERWNEPQRHYHNGRHLRQVLSTVDSLGGSDSVQLAAWWHDAVYQPQEVQNEARSAHLAGRRLHALGLDHDLLDEVDRLVLLTITHDPAESDVDGAVLCDADLGILAATPEGYDAYVSAVRREYAHVDDVGWRDGRGAVLRGLLGRPRLFRTELASVWEADARANLIRELATLRDGPSAGADRRR